MPPSQHLFGKGLRDQAFAAQQGEHLGAEPRLDYFARNGRQDGESAAGIEYAVRGKHVNMRIEVDEIAEGLDEQDHLSVTEAADAVLKAGYSTTSSSFRQIVNITLIRSGAFARVDRGRYRLK